MVVKDPLSEQMKSSALTEDFLFLYYFEIFVLFSFYLSIFSILQFMGN